MFHCFGMWMMVRRWSHQQSYVEPG